MRDLLELSEWWDQPDDQEWQDLLGLWAYLVQLVYQESREGRVPRVSRVPLVPQALLDQRESLVL